MDNCFQTERVSVYILSPYGTIQEDAIQTFSYFQNKP